MPPVDPAALISRLSEPQLGPDPSAPQAPADPAAAMGAMGAPPKPAETPETAEEKAIQTGGPNDEADRMGDDAILYEIDGRKLTPNQIKSTFDRYRDLNFRNQENSPVLKVVEAAIKAGHGKNPEDIARLMVNALRGQTSNPQMGGEDERPNTAAEASADFDEMTKWEEENAASLPPGYRDMMNNMTGISSGQQQLMQMMQSLLQNSHQVASTASGQLEDAQTQRSDAYQQKIANNLDALADKLGLDESHSGDFLTFAGERGYTLDDFIDPRLAASVMSDFKANKDSPEMERLRQIASRRQAFTGTTAQTPAASGATTPAEGGDPRLARLAERALSTRN